MKARRKKLSEQAFVYVIGSEDGPQKIGIAGDAKRRLGLLQVGNPASLKIFAEIPAMRAEAFIVERKAHDSLKDKHIRGEWFDVLPDDAVAAVKAAADDIMRSGFDGGAGKTISRHALAMARAGLGWGIRELADRSGLTPGTISRIENGKEAMAGSLRRIEQTFRDAGADFPDEHTVSVREAGNRLKADS